MTTDEYGPHCHDYPTINNASLRAEQYLRQRRNARHAAHRRARRRWLDLGATVLILVTLRTCWASDAPGVTLIPSYVTAKQLEGSAEPCDVPNAVPSYARTAVGTLAPAPKLADTNALSAAGRTRTMILRLRPNCPQADRIAECIVSACREFPRVRPSLLVAVAYVESRFDPRAVGASGERGLYQELGPGRSHDINDSTWWAAMKLDCLLRSYGSEARALGAYHTGQPCVDSYARRVLAIAKGA